MLQQRMTIEEAAAYLQMSVRNLRKHIYVLRDITPDGRFGQSLYFTRRTLDTYLRQTARQRG